jgi:hypothetical protein
MNEAKLLACPCGGQPELTEKNTDMNLSLKGVRCKKCGEEIPRIHDHAPEAIQAWNDWAGGRKPEPTATAETEHVCISDGLDRGCNCIDRIRQQLKDHHKSEIEMELSMWLDMVTMKSNAGLPPLKYSYMEGKKRKKSHVRFLYCGFCGKRAV